MLLLFAVVIFALLGLLALGVNAYRTLAEDRTDASALRQESGLLLNTVRANDTGDAVVVGGSVARAGGAPGFGHV